MRAGVNLYARSIPAVKGKVENRKYEKSERERKERREKRSERAIER